MAVTPFHEDHAAARLVEGLLPDAAKVAVLSPCAKSQRGVIVFRSDGTIIGRGFNAQPAPVSLREVAPDG